MKLGFVLWMSVCFCACAGNPPAWWNPSGAYTQREVSASSLPRPTPSISAAATPEEEEPFASEILLDPSDENVEELRLSPVSGEVFSEENPAAQPADSVFPEQKEKSSDAVQEASVPRQEERLPEDGSLPSPSVLE